MGPGVRLRRCLLTFGAAAAGAALAVAVFPGAAHGAPPAPTALEVLGTLPVHALAPMARYSRLKFGVPWADTDRNGCDTRDDILRRDLTAITVTPGRKGCVIVSGVLADPYTGTTISFRRGPTSTAVQIDHVVPLGLAWQDGAQAWTTRKRTTFANDPLNLLAVDGPTNEAKSDSDAAHWLPPNTAVRCDDVARQVAVKRKYGLWVTRSERAAMRRVLATCPGEGLPRRSEVVPPPLSPAPTVTLTLAPTPTSGGPSSPPAPGPANTAPEPTSPTPPPGLEAAL